MMSALAAFTMAVGSYWRSTSGTQCATLAANQAVVRIQQRLADTRRLGYCRAGGGGGAGAAIVYWPSDTNGDGQMQFTELRVLMHNPTSKTIELYVPALLGGASDSAWSVTAFRDPTAVDLLTAGQTPTTIAARVTAATFAADQATSTTLFPTFQFWLEVEQSDGTTSNEYAAATLRSPASPS